MRVFVYFCLLSVGPIGCFVEYDEILTAFEGQVLGGGPIYYATITAHAVDPETGSVDYDRSIASTTSDSRGFFRLEVPRHTRMMEIVARGGYTQEYWDVDNEVTLRGSGHSFALVVYADPPHTEGQTDVRPVSLSPLTSLVGALARARHDRNLDTTFEGSFRRSHDLLYDHFIGTQRLPNVCESSIMCIRPDVNSLGASESGRSGTRLLSFSAYAFELADDGMHDSRYMNTITVTDALSEDVTYDGVFNGMGEVHVDIAPNTLRSTAGNALVERYILTEWDSNEQDLRAVLGVLREASQNTNRELFGDTPPEPLDLDTH